MKTRAAILYQLNAPLVIDDIEIPALQKGQVLVRILYSGICRAQWNEMIGLKGPDRYLPHLLGHEGAAIVEDSGPGVHKVKPGDYIALSWIKGDGLEAPRSFYRRGKEVINAGAVTTFSDYAVVAENRLTKISKKIPPKVAAIIGCAIVTGFGIVHHTLQVKKGNAIVVLGAGGIGASVIMAARLAGCAQILALDPEPWKLQFAKKVGATHGILFRDNNLLEKIQKIVPRGADYAIDASGNKAAMELGFACIHSHGVMVIAGNLGKDEKICLHPFELIKGKRIVGTWGGEAIPQKDIPFYVKEYCAGRLALGKLITHEFDLDQINQAFKVLCGGKAGRIVLRNSGS